MIARMEPRYLVPANTDAGFAFLEDKEAEAAHLSFSYYRRARVEMVLADIACDALELTVTQTTEEPHVLESVDRCHRGQSNPRRIDRRFNANNRGSTSVIG